MDKKLQAVLAALNKNGTVILPSAKTGCTKKISSGNLLIDIATAGGLPQGRLMRIIGNQSSSKTQTCLKFFATNQERCHHCWDFASDCKCSKYVPFRLAFVDLENTYDPDWATANGINIGDPDDPNVFHIKPTTGEETVDIVDTLIRTRSVSVIVVDSIAAMTPSIELEKAVQEGVGGQVGITARICNAAMRKWINALSSKNDETLAPLVICINQIRQTADQYNPETTPGGKGQNFASSLDIRLERKKYLTSKGKTVTLGDKNEDHGQRIAQLIQFSIPKNKIATSGGSGEYHIWQAPDTGKNKKVGDYDYGPSLLEYGVRYGVIQKVKSEFTVLHTGEVLGTNKEAVTELIQSTPELSAQLAEKIRLKVLNG